MHMTRRNDAPSPPTQYLYVMIASGSHLRTLQRRKVYDILPGQMVLLSGDEPATGSQLTTGIRKSIRIPRKLLANMAFGLDDKVGRPIVASAQLRQLLLHQVNIAQNLGPKLDSAANFALAQHILDLTSLCVGADRDASQLASRRGLTAARLDAIKADILKNLGSADIRLPSVAAHHKISERYVQHLFENAGTSFTDFVLEHRLLLALRLLRDPTNRWRKVSDIATEAGFSDISYFNRAFRGRFDATPSDIRPSRLAAALFPNGQDDDETAPPIGRV